MVAKTSPPINSRFPESARVIQRGFLAQGEVSHVRGRPGQANGSFK
jgi:hypothetical protein